MTPPREGMNVLDWLIDISVVDVRTSEKEEESRMRVALLVDVWRAKGAAWNDREYEKNEDGGILSPGERLSVGGSTLGTVRWANGVKEFIRPGAFAQTRILTHRCVFDFVPVKVLCVPYLKPCSVHSVQCEQDCV